MFLELTAISGHGAVQVDSVSTVKTGCSRDFIRHAQSFPPMLSGQRAAPVATFACAPSRSPACLSNSARARTASAETSVTSR